MRKLYIYFLKFKNVFKEEYFIGNKVLYGYFILIFYLILMYFNYRVLDELCMMIKICSLVNLMIWFIDYIYFFKIFVMVNDFF